MRKIRERRVVEVLFPGDTEWTTIRTLGDNKISKPPKIRIKVEEYDACPSCGFERPPSPDSLSGWCQECYDIDW